MYICNITTAMMMSGTDKVSDKMQMWSLNTQLIVLGIFKVAVENAEDQLGPFNYHYTPPIFCSTAQTSSFKSWGELSTC